MNLMLYHCAEPFPDRDFTVGRCQAFTGKIFIGKAIDNFQRLSVHFIEKFYGIFIAVSQFFSTSRISASLSHNGFSIHIPFYSGNMSYLIANGKLSGFIPFLLPYLLFCLICFCRMNIRNLMTEVFGFIINYS